jgi:hypothetical protein
MKNTVASLGYEPVLSDHNGVPYLPGVTPVTSCFKAIETCDIAIVLIAKRYGENRTADTALGITHAEYRVAQEHKIPIFCLIDHDVLVLRDVWNRNSAASRNTITWPDLDSPSEVFAFVDEAMTNVPYYPYESAERACETVRTHIAYLFRGLLARDRLASTSETRSILQELAYVRKQLESLSGAKLPPQAFVAATSLIVEDSYKQLRSLMNPISGGLEASVTDLLQHESLDAYLDAKDVSVTIDEQPIAMGIASSGAPPFFCASTFAVPRAFGTPITSPSELSGLPWGHFAVKKNRSVVMNTEAHVFLRDLYSSIRAMSLQSPY